MKAALVATAKDEGPFILEWVAHHRLCGFDPIIVYQNDSTDGTVETLRTLDAIGAIRYFDNPAKRGRHQVRAYQRATEVPEYIASDWAMALDLDEFLYIKCGDGRVQDLLSQVPECEEVLVNWRFFGSGGMSSISPLLVTERFLRCDPLEDAQGLKGYKTLFRTGLYGRPGVHRVHLKDREGPDPRRVNGSGLTAEGYETLNFRCTDPDLMKLAQINHYVLRDASSFLIKSDRGSAHQPDRQLREAFWDRRNRRGNRSADDGMAQRAPAIRAEMDALDALSGGRLARLRNRSLAHYRKRVARLLEDPAYRDLYLHCAVSA